MMDLLRKNSYESITRDGDQPLKMHHSPLPLLPLPLPSPSPSSSSSAPPTPPIHQYHPSSPLPTQSYSPSPNLFLGSQNTSHQIFSPTMASLSYVVNTFAATRNNVNAHNTSTTRNGSGSESYHMVGSDDCYPEDAQSSTALSHSQSQSQSQSLSQSQSQSPSQSPELESVSAQNTRRSPEEPLVLNIPKPSPRRKNQPKAPYINTGSPISLHRKIQTDSDEPLIRSASSHSLALRHPTPDLQVLQGAYAGNIELLERTAEQLTMTSSIEDAIRELHTELKRSDSRRSSLLSAMNDMPPVSRQVSNAGSIVEVNSAARSGGYSPAGYMMSPKGSISTKGRGRSASKSSRFGSRPEPELEGRPLDSFVSSFTSKMKTSIAEQDEGSSTLTRPVVNLLDSHDEIARPTTSDSSNTFEQADKMWTNFDGIHSGQEQKEPSEHGEEEPEKRMSYATQLSVPWEEPDYEQNRISPGPEIPVYEDDHNVDQRRLSSGALLSIPGDEPTAQRRVSSVNLFSRDRPQSYADPITGQQMVYYPAPVPMMLNLPQKLSKNPSSIARNKRRTQLLSGIPPAARQSAIWLPDVLETDDLPSDDEAHNMEYVPQHQRMSMGGRRNTQDFQHLPPQLKANAYFDLPAHTEVVALKGQSAVDTLDSILDASAHAPVTAFTDHAFAGHLGAEVYGKTKSRNSTANLLTTPDKKRRSSFNLLKKRRSSTNLPTDNTANTLERKTTRSPIEEDDDDENNKDTTPLRKGRSGGQDDEEEDEEEGEEDEGQLEDEVYRGPPTTLLAELQLRKQQAKERTKPKTAAAMHSTLLELDTVHQVEQKTRKHKRVTLAWQADDADQGEDDDDDVPLGLLVPKAVQEQNRPIGLMERRELEDNEPLSRRRDRLQGKPPITHRMSMMTLTQPAPPEEEGETLAQRSQRLKQEAELLDTGALPAARPVSGDFASEMMSQFGELKSDVKGKGREITATPGPEEEETLGQRRKRLQAEREARAKEVGTGVGATTQERPVLEKRRSMADILQVHPAAGASRNSTFGKPSKPATGLLGLHEKQSMQRASTMSNLNLSSYADIPVPRNSASKPNLYSNTAPRPSSHNLYNTQSSIPQFAQPTMNYNLFANPDMTMPWANPYATGGFQNMNMNMGNMNMNVGYGMPNPMAQATLLQMNGIQPLNQNQLDMVERWRQSVMQ